MNMTSTLARRALFAVSCAIPVAGLAAPCSGININHTTLWSPSIVVKGAGGVASVKFTSVIVSDDPSAPFHLASGECTGAAVLGPDGKIAAASGHCARKDKDGDLIFEDWVVPSPGKGTSKVTRGTGKFANASWTYEFQHRPLHAPTAAVTWKGDCR